jgi:molecular chaperone GrpE
MNKRPKESEGLEPKADIPQADEMTPENASPVEPGSADKGVASPEQEIEALKAQLTQKDKEIAELKDKYLRTLADHENARKRLRHQSEETVRLERENLLRELLPIIDNLELAVAAARGGGNGKPVVEGVEMVLRSIHDFLRGHGVSPHQAVGKPFDPQFHEAVDHIESLEHKPNTVISELNRGYVVGERVLRPARVAVAKAPAETAKPPAEAERENAGVNGHGSGKPDGKVEND